MRTKHYNWTNLTKQYKEAEMAKMKLAILPESFLPHCVADIGENIKPIKASNGKYSAIETMKELEGTANYEHMRGMLNFLYTVTRGKIMQGYTQTSYPRYASLTPIPLYAFKEHHGVNYNDWDRSDERLRGFLGKFWFNDNIPPEGNILKLEAVITSYNFEIRDDIEKLRKVMLTEKSTGNMKGLLSYKNNLSIFTINNVPINSSLNYLFMQTWLANIAVRVPDAMILDPYDWDKTPKAFDAVESVQNERIPTKKAKSIYEDFF